MHLTDDSPLPPLPPRDPRGHKGTFGSVGVVGGQHTDDTLMVGAPAFCALGALRVGCGLCRVCAPEGVIEHALTIANGATGVVLPSEASGLAPAIDALCAQSDCLIVGPGLGVSDASCAVVVRAMGQEEVALVLDADGLNVLAGLREAHRDLRAPAVLTPHPGEFGRLSRAIGLGDLEPDATGAATLAQRLGAVVVLKSSTTVVTDGHRAWSHDGANAVLGTGGTGDVLAGAIGGLIAQHHRTVLMAGERTITSEHRGGLSLYDLARWGVSLHALAARQWRAQHDDADAGMTPVELSANLVEAMTVLRARG